MIIWWNCIYIYIHMFFFLSLSFTSQFSGCFYLWLSRTEPYFQREAPGWDRGGAFRLEGKVCVWWRTDNPHRIPRGHGIDCRSLLFRWCFPLRSTSIEVIMRSSWLFVMPMAVVPQRQLAPFRPSWIYWHHQIQWPECRFLVRTHPWITSMAFRRHSPRFFCRFWCNWHGTWIWQVKHCWPGL